MLAQREQLLGFFETQHFQCAGDLCAVVGQCREIGTLGVIAEEGVQDLFHVPQIRLYLTGHLRQHQTFLRAPRHLVEDRRVRSVGQRLVLCRSVDPDQHCIDLLRKLRGNRGEVVQRGIGEKKAGRIFHRQRIGHGPGRELVEAAGECSRESR